MTALGIETDDEVTVTYPADVPVELPPWSPPPRVVVDLSVPDGIELVLSINGIQLMPEERGRANPADTLQHVTRRGARR